MQDVNVLVVFYSRFGETERLALAAAVGAVQGRGNIRLRRLADAADEATISGVPEWRVNRDHMKREYVTPRETDVVWADAILTGIDPFSAEAGRWSEWLRKMVDQGIPVPSTIESFLTTAEAADGVEAARRLGRATADAARARRV